MAALENTPRGSDSSRKNPFAGFVGSPNILPYVVFECEALGVGRKSLLVASNNKYSEFPVLEKLILKVGRDSCLGNCS